MKLVRIPHTGSQSPYYVLSGLLHRVRQLADLMAGHPDKDNIFRAVLAGKAEIIADDPADGSVTVRY